MSNSQVGPVYQQIISDVIESSRVDFEEGGVEEGVLEELKKVWQQKLSQLNVASFPWDPKPEPQALLNPPTIPSNGAMYQTMAAPPNAMGQMPGGPRIKPEPGMEPNYSTLPPLPAMPMMPSGGAVSSSSIAHQRAVQNVQALLHQTHQDAMAQARRDEAVHGGRPMHGQPLPADQQQALLHQQMLHRQYHQNPQQPMPQGGQQHMQRPHMSMPMPNSHQNRPSLSQQEYNRAMAQSAQQAAETLKRNSVGGAQAQTDGAGDAPEESFSVMKQYNAAGEQIGLGRVEIDEMIRSKIEAMGRSMEGGGLMLPLKRASTASSRRAGREHGSKQDVSKDARSLGGQQDGTDGPDIIKDEELDEDAINSDLDDPDELGDGDDDDDEANGHIMLCTYDKVQRVKNKWKCVMKDGVLTVNGTEYVFHRATGEYEW